MKKFEAIDIETEEANDAKFERVKTLTKLNDWLSLQYIKSSY